MCVFNSLRRDEICVQSKVLLRFQCVRFFRLEGGGIGNLELSNRNAVWFLLFVFRGLRLNQCTSGFVFICRVLLID